MQLENKPIIVISSTNSEEIPNFVRAMFKDCRLNGSKKLVINFVSSISYPEFVQNAREALLDNIDLGVYIYIWKPEEVDQMMRRIMENHKDMKGMIIYCDDNNKHMIEKILPKIPNSIKANIIKDYCK
ncbi:hypothetical protein SULI_00800 [Saccharolobus solfataricus]|uniref:DUF5751 domain-containing protein n=3 Tax=Saccharolobus solfataricus TaxID=2287 RepID=Q97W84_SACS2|nr:DUF5751 family protein [Saccharolobus solfataricus]AAK42504.1 Hypothetical protein SSO2352 [Saccharolobus solfataricus P2]AKA72602.1 hypothetical protein SULB_0158 [Saccharolobus solfataricus]AKA75301.1 hypothetical protein SULC_0157 [Saccharolobus solfataricus]AKA77994.1 hypothetical protein SULA_0157 [Saccharolobus solfataricus]AZF67113.1 hypothetical protein SULG_00800 [Saccharolobus solfataricus]